MSLIYMYNDREQYEIFQNVISVVSRQGIVLGSFDSSLMFIRKGRANFRIRNWCRAKRRWNWCRDNKRIWKHVGETLTIWGRVGWTGLGGRCGRYTWYALLIFLLPIFFSSVGTFLQRIHFLLMQFPQEFHNFGVRFDVVGGGTVSVNQQLRS